MSLECGRPLSSQGSLSTIAGDLFNGRTDASEQQRPVIPLPCDQEPPSLLRAKASAPTPNCPDLAVLTAGFRRLTFSSSRRILAT